MGQIKQIRLSDISQTKNKIVKVFKVSNPTGPPPNADPDRFTAPSSAAADAAPAPSTANGAALLGLGGRLCPSLPTLTMERGKTAAFTIGEEKLAVAVHNNYKTFNRKVLS